MNEPTKQPVKPGFRTSEFWLSLIAQIISGLMAAGVFAEDSTWARILGVAGVVLASMGYSHSRGTVKREAVRSPFLGILAVLLLLAGSGAAQEALPVATVETTTAQHAAAWSEAGPLSAPHPIGGGFSSIALPHQMGILLVTDGTVRPFRRITTDKRVIYTAGSRPLPGDLDGVEYIPDDPATYRRGTSHELLEFEALPVLFPNTRWEEPSAARRARVLLELQQTSNLAELGDHSRLVKLVQNFDDRSLPAVTAFGATDMGWQLHHWHYTMGGRPMVGWYNGVCTRGSAGFDNWHYDGLLWLALHYLAAPRPELYRFGFQQAVAHACFGRSWQGPEAGFARYEKGGAYIGENYSAKAWEKQWSSGLIVWYRLTDNPILGMQVDLMREQLRKSDPDQVWKGYWGARIGARYLEELLAHYLHRREPWLAAKAKRYVANCRAWRNPEGHWPNLGNRGLAEESPWMQAQLVTAIFRWREHVPDIDEAFPLDELMRSGREVWRYGHTRDIGGKPLLKYRFITKDVPPRSMHITAFAVPMLRYMAAHAPDSYGALYREVRDFVFGYAGTDFSGILAQTPTPLDELGYRFPREGPGWSKAMRFYLEAAR